jgi:hypothetical protein
MRTLVALALVLSVPGLAAAQEYSDYISIKDGFKITFPAEPKISETTWTSQQSFVLPARVYTLDKGKERYSVTVVDYSGIEQMGKDKVKGCPVGAPLCRGTDISGPGLWKHDVREAIEFATFKLLQRDAKLTDLTWSQHDLVEGNDIQLVNNADQSRTYAVVAMHEMKLFIVEATVPKNTRRRRCSRPHWVGGQERHGHPLPDGLQQRVPRHAAVPGATACRRGWRGARTRRRPRRAIVTVHGPRRHEEHGVLRLSPCSPCLRGSFPRKLP